jgi:hypothetical protein
MMMMKRRRRKKKVQGLMKKKRVEKNQIRKKWKRMVCKPFQKIESQKLRLYLIARSKKLKRRVKRKRK